MGLVLWQHRVYVCELLEPWSVGPLIRDFVCAKPWSLYKNVF